MQNISETPILPRERNLPEKICLIIPPSTFLLDERVFMSLGILKVAAVLEKAAVAVEVLDLSGVKNFLEAASDYAATRHDIHWFGLTATTPQLPAAVKIVGAVRAIRKDVKIILGGPHITLVNAAYKREKRLGLIHGRAMKALRQMQERFDRLVAGDGEDAVFLAFAENAPQLIDADDSASPLFLTNERLTGSPFPARHLVDVNSYHYSIEGIDAISLIAQLGCPFGCGFCGGRESAAFRKIRMRTSENVLEEIIHLYRTTGKRGFMLYDDELNVNTNMIPLMHLIAKAQRDFDIRWRLRGFIKSQLFTDEQAAAMREAGFRWILVGFESGSPAILEAIQKRATREENTRCMEIARRHDLKVKALMSIGHPGESLETIRATREWLLEARPDDFDIAIITCYPGTPYYDHALPVRGQPGIWVYEYPQTGAKLYQREVDYVETANYYKGDPDGGYTAYVYTDYLTSEALVAERDRLERDVRAILGIPFHMSAPAMLYEHSMGQPGVFPGNILRKTARGQ